MIFFRYKDFHNQMLNMDLSYIYIHTHEYIYLYIIHTHIQTHICVCVCVCKYIHTTHLYLHLCTYIYIYTYMYINLYRLLDRDSAIDTRKSTSSLPRMSINWWWDQWAAAPCQTWDSPPCTRMWKMSCHCWAPWFCWLCWGSSNPAGVPDDKWETRRIEL